MTEQPTSGHSFVRKNLFFFLGLFLTFSITLGIAELLLRLGKVYQTGFERNEGKYKSYYHSPYTTHYPVLPKRNGVISTPEFSYAVSVNQYGFRDRDWSVTKTNKQRIMVLGDSFVEGVGAPADSTWPALLQRMMNVDSPVVEVFNAGISGSDPVFQHRLFAHKLTVFSPDILFMSINFSDLHDLITRGGDERFLPDGRVAFRKGPDWEPLYRYSYLVRFVLHAILRYDFSLLSPGDYAQRSQQAIQEICRQATTLDAFCRLRHIRFALIIHPYVDPYDAFIQRQDILLTAIPTLQQQGISVVNLFPVFRQKINKTNYKQYAWPVDKHFTAQGYSFFAQCVAGSLQQDTLWGAAEK